MLFKDFLSVALLKMVETTSYPIDLLATGLQNHDGASSSDGALNNHAPHYSSQISRRHGCAGRPGGVHW